ncbi:MAG: hypothetical protein JOZ99_14865 [Actinobacteria bacterium]|nr:hypothetical protein [Actinomycetota bacterium]
MNPHAHHEPLSSTSPALSRRSFLAATGGLLLAAACGSSGKSASTGVRPNGANALLLSIEPYVSAAPERIAFALADDKGRWIAGPPATIAVTPPGGVAGPPMPTVLHAEGLPTGRGVYVIELPLTRGTWTGVVQVPGRTAARVPWQATPSPTVVTPGAKALVTPSPTVTNTLGVDPLCTRVPACPLHTISLDHALGTGRPVALMFATPARCQSRYCGPVLDQLLAVADTYRDRVQLIHVEIYKDATSDALVPTVDEWQLPGEPWLFGIDRSGTVVGRLDGAMGTDEVRALLDKIA